MTLARELLEAAAIIRDLSARLDHIHAHLTEHQRTRLEHATEGYDRLAAAWLEDIAKEITS